MELPSREVVKSSEGAPLPNAEVLMRKTLLTLAILSAASVFTVPDADAHSAREFAPGQSNFLPPGHAKEPGEPARDYAPGRRKKADERRCHRDVQRHLHDTYSHPADHYHRRSDCHPVIV